MVQVDSRQLIQIVEFARQEYLHNTHAATTTSPTSPTSPTSSTSANNTGSRGRKACYHLRVAIICNSDSGSAVCSCLTRKPD
ncbi:unnamed protein product [Protopolystoma xenopodis]|uniref:Uncharacterized protein n=1 Tax=Protopolystoma xenopodis TaxID=117903 RepID=A0A448XSF6_9PLAT|nr:unnamed protein product [Protopolystoma xenopodis]